jgi:hypothetical protein
MTLEIRDVVEFLKSPMVWSDLPVYYQQFDDFLLSINVL